MKKLFLTAIFAAAMLSSQDIKIYHLAPEQQARARGKYEAYQNWVKGLDVARTAWEDELKGLRRQYKNENLMYTQDFSAAVEDRSLSTYGDYTKPLWTTENTRNFCASQGYEKREIVDEKEKTKI